MYLPSCPVSDTQAVFLQSGRLKLYLVSSVSVVALCFGMVLFVVVNPMFIPYTVFALLTAFYLSVSYGVGFLGRDFNSRKHNDLVAKWLDRAAHQEVDVFLPVCREPRDILLNTWRHVSDLKLAHEGRLNVHVLDDGKDNWVQDVAHGFGFNYIRRDGNELKKAGNLRHAFARTSAEFILILDADFCPARNFLIQTLPYLYEYPDVAIVQTPQFFEHHESQNYIQRGAGSIQELFYRLIQVNRDTFKAAICVGTNAVYRRAPLVPMGGTAAIGYSEDVRTGFRLQHAGHNVKYIPLVLATGTCPEDWKQFFTQQYRWAMGSLSLMFSREFWTSTLSVVQKLCYMTGMLYYFTTGLSVLFAFTPSIFILLFKPEYAYWYNLLWSIPSLLLTNLYMRHWQKTAFEWSTIECRQVSYYAHAFALFDTLFDSAEAWIATGSAGKSKRHELFKRVLPTHVVLIVLMVWSLIGYRIYQGYSPYNFLLLFGFTLYYIGTYWRVIRDS